MNEATVAKHGWVLRFTSWGLCLACSFSLLIYLTGGDAYYGAGALLLFVALSLITWLEAKFSELDPVSELPTDRDGQ